MTDPALRAPAPWLKLLSPLPLGCQPRRRPVAPPGSPVGAPGGPLHGVDELVVDVSDAPFGTRIVVATVDAEGRPTSISDHVHRTETSDASSPCQESLSGRIDPGSVLCATRWSSEGPFGHDGSVPPRMSKREPDDDERSQALTLARVLSLQARGRTRQRDGWLETARLALRNPTYADLDWLVELYADPDVTRYLGGARTRAETETALRDRILAYAATHPDLGVWVSLERETGERVGLHLLCHVHGESLVQIGYVLVKSAWGRGYATEMAEALVRYGFADLELPRIVALADRPNFASHHVLEKIGLRRRGERELTHPAYAGEGPMAWFERDRDDWLAERGRGG